MCPGNATKSAFVLEPNEKVKEKRKQGIPQLTARVTPQVLPKLSDSQYGNKPADCETCVTLITELYLLLENLADKGVICGTDKERLFELVERSPHHQRSVQSHRGGIIFSARTDAIRTN